MENKMDLSFSGAGFMGCYYFGVVDCWNKYIPRERVNRVAGASAGSLIAAYYLMDLPLVDCLKEIIGLTEEIRRRPLGVFDRKHQIVDVLPKIVDKIFPDDAHKRVSGRLHICMTRLKDMKKVIVNEFETRKDLIDALNCSCFIPVWSGNHVSTYKGVKHIDGGFSDNMPVFDEHTIRICCFSGPSDISPYDRAKLNFLSGTLSNMPLYFNFANCRRGRKALFPPPASFIVDILELGFHDTKGFILSNDLIQCESCYNKTSLKDQPIYQRAAPTLSPAVTPAISRAGSFRVLKEGDENNNDAGKKAKHQQQYNQRRTFDAILSEKLRSCSVTSSEATSGSSSSEAAANCKLPSAPTIVINEIMMSDENNDASEDSSSQSGSSAESDGSDGLAQTSATAATAAATGGARLNLKQRTRGIAVAKEQQHPKQKRNSIGARRWSSVVQDDIIGGQSSLLVMQDRFTLAPNPLPSCPPSPNLNRHCTECIRLRQEARADTLEMDIRRVAEQFLTDSEREPMKTGGLRDTLASPYRWLRQLGSRSSYEFQTTGQKPPTRPAELPGVRF